MSLLLFALNISLFPPLYLYRLHGLVSRVIITFPFRLIALTLMTLNFQEDLPARASTIWALKTPKCSINTFVVKKMGKNLVAHREDRTRSLQIYG